MAGPNDQNPVDPALGPKLLQAPWRMEYLQGLKGEDGARVEGAASTKPESSSCFLAEYWANPGADEKNNVIVRSGLGMVLLNAYPYSNGHLLVAMGEGRPRLMDYDGAQRGHLWMLTDVAADLAEAALSPQGLNIGVNQGRAAGAGVPGHLHVHVVPRWGGDVNFISVVARVRVIPGSLEAMAERYRESWVRIRARWGGVTGSDAA